MAEPDSKDHEWKTDPEPLRYEPPRLTRVGSLRDLAQNNSTFAKGHRRPDNQGDGGPQPMRN